MYLERKEVKAIIKSLELEYDYAKIMQDDIEAEAIQEVIFKLKDELTLRV